MRSSPYLADRTTAQWQELDRQHYLHPFTDYKNLHAKGSRVIVKAEGVYLYDDQGHRLLDGSSGALVANVGCPSLVTITESWLYKTVGYATL